MDLFLNVLRSFAEVLVIGALLGAGLPALFATGVRVLAWSDGAVDSGSRAGAGMSRTSAKVLAYLIFALVVIIVGLGIAVIVASGLGLDMHFEGLIPVFTR